MIGEMSVQPMGRMGKISIQRLPNLFLKILAGGAVTTEAGSLLHYFTTLNEKAILSFGDGSYFGAPSKATSSGRERKDKFVSKPKGPVNILNAVIRSARSRHRCKKEGPTAAVAGWSGGDESQLPTM